MMSVTSESSSRCSTISRAGFHVAGLSASHRLLPDFPRLLRAARHTPRSFSVPKIGSMGGRSLTRSAFSSPDHGRILFPVTVFRFTMLRRWRIAVSRILLGDLIELLLGKDVFEEAFFSRSQELECLVEHLSGVRNHIARKLDPLRGGKPRIPGPLSPRRRAPDVPPPTARSGSAPTLSIGALDASLVAVEDRQGNRHTQGVRDRAFQSVGRIVLVGIGLERAGTG